MTAKKTKTEFTFHSKAPNGIVRLPSGKARFVDGLLTVSDKGDFDAMVSLGYTGPPSPKETPAPVWPGSVEKTSTKKSASKKKTSKKSKPPVDLSQS